VLLHDGEELDDDLGGRSDEHLPLATLLGVEHVLEGIVEDTDANHGWLLPAAAARGGEGRSGREQAKEGARRPALHSPAARHAFPDLGPS